MNSRTDMTTEQIRAELRRSACEDADPWNVENEAFMDVVAYINPGEFMLGMNYTAMRVLYLLVAEALT